MTQAKRNTKTTISRKRKEWLYKALGRTIILASIAVMGYFFGFVILSFIGG